MKSKFVISMFLMFFLMSGSSVFGQMTAEIKTSAQCDMCKETIEKELNLTKGIKSAVLDVKTKIVTVTYKEKVITLDEIRNIISNIGYDADLVPANRKKYAKLPKCCKKPKDRGCSSKCGGHK